MFVHRRELFLLHARSCTFLVKNVLTRETFSKNGWNFSQQSSTVFNQLQNYENYNSNFANMNYVGAYCGSPVRAPSSRARDKRGVRQLSRSAHRKTIWPTLSYFLWYIKFNPCLDQNVLDWNLMKFDKVGNVSIPEWTIWNDASLGDYFHHSKSSCRYPDCQLCRRNNTVPFSTNVR